MPSSRVRIFFARRFLFLFHGNFGGTGERCCLAVSMVSCRRQIVSRCKCICPVELKTALALLRVNCKRVDAVPTASHIDPVLPGAKLTSFWFPLGAGRWGALGGSCWLQPTAGLSAFVRDDSGL